MRVNVFVNGTFRYPEYIRHYAEAGVLGRFAFAHRRGRTAAALGLPPEAVHNVWPKHYAAAAAFRAAPTRWAPALTDTLADAWQSAALRRWTDCDSLEAVTGAVADRVIAHAGRRGARVLGHPVTTHPVTMRRLLDAAMADVGLPPDPPCPADLARRLDEIAACDALVVDSPFVARSFVESGVAAERITVVRPAVDFGRFRPRGPDERDRSYFIVVCVGTVTPRKAQQVLLRAWRMLRLPQARLILVGPRGRHGAAVVRGHADAFTHIPHLDHAALRAVLGRASCFVLVSAEDGFAQAPLEAMACGVPVILSDTVGAADLVRSGQNGYVVPPFDPEALAEAIERLYRDSALADALGLAAAAEAQRGGSWRDYVAQVLALHRRLVDGNQLAGRAAA